MSCKTLSKVAESAIRKGLEAKLDPGMVESVLGAIMSECDRRRIFLAARGQIRVGKGK